MAAVYRAEDVRHGRSVAVKVLDPELISVAAERFVRVICPRLTLGLAGNIGFNRQRNRQRPPVAHQRKRGTPLATL
jgi:hypothetical protein